MPLKSPLSGMLTYIFLIYFYLLIVQQIEKQNHLQVTYTFDLLKLFHQLFLFIKIEALIDRFLQEPNQMQENKHAVESKTLWIGDLEPWMDEATLSSLIQNLGYAIQGFKLVRDKATNQPSKYGFIEFKTKQHALNFYQSYNGMPIPNYVHKSFKLNWSTYGTTKTSQINSLKPASEIQVYVGDLPLNLTDHKLLQFFKIKYPSAFMSKIITDPTTKASKGYGFVKFSNIQEANKALIEMNGQMIGDKIIKVSQAHQKQKEQSLEGGEQENQTQAAQRIKLYENFYSMLNDPLLKAEYEKQAMKTFQLSDSVKGSFKQKLQNVRTLSYQETRKSEDFLNHLPKMLAFRSRLQVEQKTYF